MAADDVHDAAATGYRRRSETYASARPTYHPAILDAVAHAIAGQGRVVEIGAGTGIATAALIERGLDMVAVEPVAAMRATFARQLPGVAVVDGSAEAIPVEARSATAVVVAQAFHWFDHQSALDEIARVLAVGGRLVTLWNVRDESVPWMAAYTSIQDRYQADTPRYREMRWRRAIESDPRFTLADEVSRPNPQPSNPDHTVERFLSTSFIARLDEATQRELERQIRDLVGEFRKSGDLGDSFDFPYTTEAQIWKVNNSPQD